MYWSGQPVIQCGKQITSGLKRGVLPKSREEKINTILTATLAVLSKKGYENSTIHDIAEAAKISRGLLHYYFTDKEDIVAKALEFRFGSMWDEAIGEMSEIKSSEELVDAMIQILKRNIREHPEFTAILFETWCSSRRSKKIKKVFSEGIDKAIGLIKDLLDLAGSAGIIKTKATESEGIVRVLLAMYHGIAMQLIDHPEKIDDEGIWMPIRKMLLSVF